MPVFADQVGTVNIPGSNAAPGETVTISESQTPFTDAGGNGPIPTVPSGYTAISYTASFVSPAQTVNFTSNLITVTAGAPCEIVSGKTYVAFVYANGGGLGHVEIGPAGLTDTHPFPTTATTFNGKFAIAFAIDLSKDIPQDEEPDGTGLEIVVASQP